jgi:hypothetical protein
MYMPVTSRSVAAALGRAAGATNSGLAPSTMRVMDRLTSFARNRWMILYAGVDV